MFQGADEEEDGLVEVAPGEEHLDGADGVAENIGGDGGTDAGEKDAPTRPEIAGEGLDQSGGVGGLHE